MSDTNPPAITSTAPPVRRSNFRGVLLWSAVSITLLTSGISLLLTLRLAKALNRRIADVEWAGLASASARGSFEVQPEVGTIQFVERGCSVEFTAVTYNASGLALQGKFGNPTHLTISSITLHFRAHKYFHSAREAFLRAASPWTYDDSEFQFFPSPEEIGHGQTGTIGSLGPGGSATFEVTVPNVVQSKEGFVLQVSMSGERYSY